MKLGELAPCCPACGKSNYRQRNIAWLGIDIMLCSDCEYSAPVPAKADEQQEAPFTESSAFINMRDRYIKKWNAKLDADPRMARKVDDREVKPL